MSETGKYAKDDYIVYPAHGVGRVLGVEEASYGGVSIELLVIQFEADRMVLRVPVAKGEQAGLRRLSSRKLFWSCDIQCLFRSFRNLLGALFLLCSV